MPLAEKIAAAAVKADLNSRRYIFTFFKIEMSSTES